MEREKYLRNYKGIMHITSTLYRVQTIIHVGSFLNFENIEASSDRKEFCFCYVAGGSFLV